MKRTILSLLLLTFPLFAAEEQNINLTANVTRTHFLEAATPTVSATIDIDAATDVRFVFGSASKDLSIELVGPSGQRIRTGDADSATAQIAVFPPPSDPASKGANYLFTLKSPQSGAWTYRVTSPSPLAATRAVLVSINSSSAIRSGIAGGGSEYRVDREARLSVITVENTNVRKDVTVTGILSKPGDAAFSPRAVAFRDDGVSPDSTLGDGLYTCAVLPGAPGSYQLSATVRGANFERFVSAQIHVQPVRASFTGTKSDRGVDLNGDTFLDRIVVAPGLEISQPGEYRVAITLQAGNGKQLAHDISATLAVGMSAPEVSFRASELRQMLGAGGPYLIAAARLESLDGDPALLDERFDLGSTGAYTLAQLQRKEVEIAGPGRAGGQDRTFPVRNGLWDVFDIQIPLVAIKGGYHYCTARLYDRNGKEIGIDEDIEALGHDPREIWLQFDARPIGENGVDGPFYLRNLMCYGSGSALGNDGFFQDAFTTPAFPASQFEGWVQRDITPPVLNVSVTPTTLWPVNHKMVEITVTMSVTDDFDPNPVVKLESITSNEGQNSFGDGNTSPDIEIGADGKIWLRAERSGAAEGRIYVLTWSARDATGNSTNKSAEVRVPHDQGK